MADVATLEDRCGIDAREGDLSSVLQGRHSEEEDGRMKENYVC